MKTTTALWLIVVAIVVAAVAVFAVENAQPVPVRFLNWQAMPSLALLVIASFICGGVIMSAVSLPGRIRLGLRVRSLERQLAAVPAPAKPEPALPGGPAPDAALPAGEGAQAPSMLPPPASGPAVGAAAVAHDPQDAGAPNEPPAAQDPDDALDPRLWHGAPAPRERHDGGAPHEGQDGAGTAATGSDPAAPRPPLRP